MSRPNGGLLRAPEACWRTTLGASTPGTNAMKYLEKIRGFWRRNAKGSGDLAHISTLSTNALCAESEVRKAVERSSYAVALKFRVFFLFLKSVKF